MDLSGLKGSKWGVVALFASAAGLVAGGLVAFDDPAVQSAAGLTAGVVAAGLGGLVALLASKFLGKPTDKPGEGGK